MQRLLLVFGSILVAGGLAHSLGVGRLYLSEGVPETNRVLLDLWVAEAQLLGGVLYLTAYQSMRRGRNWRVVAAAGAATVIGYALPFVPVLFARASVRFRIAPTLYLLTSVWIAASVIGAMRRDRKSH